MYNIFYLYLSMLVCSHFNSGTPTRLTATQSATNIDSNYIPITGHVGTISDSLSDSIFMPIVTSALPRKTEDGSVMDVAIQLADTDTYSVQVYNYQTDSAVVQTPGKVSNYTAYKYVKPIRIFIATQLLYKGANDFQFGLLFNNLNYSVPDCYEFVFTMKTLAGKGAHLIRFTPNYITQP